MTITLDNVTFSFSNSSQPIFESLNWKCIPSEVIGLIGENGSGKSTFLRLLCGLLKPNGGKIKIGDQEVKGSTSIRDQVCYVPENAKLFLLGPTLKKDFQRIRPDADLTKLLEETTLQDLTNSKLYSLSEGQRRLCAIWLAFQLERKFVLLDEPTIGMDIQGKQFFAQLLQNAINQGKTVIIASNDSRILPLFSRVTVLQEKRIILDGPPEKVLYQLEKKSNLVPNQLVLIISELQKSGYDIPNFVSINDFNDYLRNLLRRKT